MKEQHGLLVHATAATDGVPHGVLWAEIGISLHLSPAKRAIAVAKTH